jgi:hypothetical protein
VRGKVKQRILPMRCLDKVEDSLLTCRNSLIIGPS